MSENPSNSLRQMAEEIFAITVLTWRDRIATKGGGDELSESQFLTLDLLERNSPLTVGELQRSIGVLPAQMSRIIRSLESSFDAPLIRCELNQQDKRKIDVNMTPPGKKLYEEFRTARLSRTEEMLRHLPEHDRLEFVRICKEIKSLYQNPSLESGSDSKQPTPAS